MWQKWRAENLFYRQKFIFWRIGAASGSFSALSGYDCDPKKVLHRVFHLLAFRLLAFPASDAVKFLSQSNKYPAVKSSVDAFAPASYRKIPGGKKDATEKNDSVRG